MSRLPNTTTVLRTLFALSGNECAFPGCTHRLINSEGTYIAQICHIEAANKKGQRYNAIQTDEERRSVDNLMVLCYEHHIVTNNKQKYPAESLRKMKKAHEDRFRDQPVSIADEILEKILPDLQSQLDSLYELSQDTNTTVHVIKETLDQFVSRSAIQPAFDQNKFYIVELDSIKELKKHGKIRTVIDMLLGFKGRNWEQLNPETMYKVMANLGMCYLELHEKNKAGEALQKLKNINYETPESLALLALGYSISGKDDEFDACFKKAVLIAGENVNLWVAYIERHKKQKQSSELLKEIPAGVAESPQVLFHLGQMIIDEGRKKDGIELLKKALGKLDVSEEKLSDTKAIIATHILKDMVYPFKFNYGHYSAEEKQDFQEAKQLLTESWENIKDTELAQTKWYIVMNRGVINKLTGEKDQALSDFQRAFDLSKEYLPYKYLLMMYLQVGNFAMAEQLLATPVFSKELTEEEKFEQDTFKVRLLCLQERFREAIPVLSAHLDETNEKRYIEILSVIISIYFENKVPQEAAPYSEILKTKFPGLVSSHLFSGYINLKKGEKELALEDFDRATSMLTDTTPDNELFELASSYSDLEEYEKAILQFEKIVNRTLYNDFSKGLIHAWYQSGNIQRALTLAEELYTANPQEPYLVEIIGNIYQETKHYDKAIAITDQFLQTATGKARDYFSFRGARFYSYKRDWENVKRLALQVSDISRIPLDDVFMLAHLLVASGEEEKGMEIAFEARTRFFDRSEAHLKYISISINVKKEKAQLFPSVTAPECAMMVRTESGKEETFLITDKNAKGENILKQDDEFALQLIGKSVGDELVIQKGFSIEYRIVITAVMDIYVYAFRESLNLFETRFAGKHNVGVFRANPGQPDDQVEQVIRSSTLDRNDFQKQVYDLYNQRKATIGVLAGLFKRNTVKEWFSLISSPDVFVISYSHNEIPEIEQAVNDKKTVIIDLTALLTNFFLYPDTNFFSLAGSNYIVSQSVIDELHEFYEEMEDHVKDGMLTLGYQDGRMIAQSLSSEDIQRQREKISAIIEWCKNNTTVTVPASLLEVNRNNRKWTAEILGDSFYDTILLASENNGTVLSDDDTFKNILRSEHGIPSFSTYQLAQWLGSKEKITREIFEKFSFQLIAANNIFIPVTANQLWSAFDLAGFQLRKPFTTAVKGLIILIPQFSAGTLASFLRKLYLEAGLTLTREQTILFIMGEISKRGDFPVVKNLLIKQIENEFRYLPNFKDEVLGLVNAFY